MWAGCDSSDPGGREEPGPLPFADAVVGTRQVTQVEDGNGTTSTEAGTLLYAFERMAFTQYPFDAGNDGHLRLRCRVDTLRAEHKLSVYKPPEAPSDTQLVGATRQGEGVETAYYLPQAPSMRNCTLRMERRSFSADMLASYGASSLRALRP